MEHETSYSSKLLERGVQTTRKDPKYHRQPDERKYEPEKGKESLEGPILPFRSSQFEVKSNLSDENQNQKIKQRKTMTSSKL